MAEAQGGGGRGDAQDKQEVAHRQQAKAARGRGRGFRRHESPTAGDPVPDDWYDKETIRALSVHEADTITETRLSEFARRTLIEIFDRWRAARRAPSPGEAADELRAGVAAVLTPAEVEALGAWLAAKAASLGEP